MSWLKLYINILVHFSEKKKNFLSLLFFGYPNQNLKLLFHMYEKNDSCTPCSL